MTTRESESKTPVRTGESAREPCAAPAPKEEPTVWEGEAAPREGAREEGDEAPREGAREGCEEQSEA